MSLELKPSKTRISHTLNPYAGSVGFSFLGFTIRHVPVGKHHSGRNSQGKRLGFKIIITPSQEKVKRHIEALETVIDSCKTAPQQVLINRLNPIIRGWCNYYSTVDNLQPLHRHCHDVKTARDLTHAAEGAVDNQPFC
jgi:RNA-directed DNA polymerase